MNEMKINNKKKEMELRNVVEQSSVKGAKMGSLHQLVP